MYKILTVIMGVLMVIGGFYCIMTPGATFLALAPLTAIFVIVDAVGNIIMWFKERKNGTCSGWMLVGAIISFLLGIFMLGSYFMQFIYDVMLAYIVAIWVILGGGVRIAAALKLRKAKKAGMPINGSWVLILVLGIVMIIAGIMGFLNPTVIALSLGIMIGASIVASGVSIISLAFM